jgi:ribosomal protein S18 acetylase RimI-like enzyme
LQNVRLAKDNDIPSLHTLYQRCTTHLLSQSIFQWDKSYPTLEHITYHVDASEMYVLVGEGDEDKILGAVVLNEWESPEWQGVQWKGTKPLIIHMLCVNPSAQNEGIGKRLLNFSETIAKESGYKSIRLDSYSGNRKSLAFYKNAQFEKVGTISFSGKKVGCETYICFEKKI